MGLILPIVAYLLGCLSPGYVLVRRATGTDLRAQHTGSTGARNAGRVAGARVAALVFVLDVLKGAAAVALARVAGDSPAIESVCLVAVVAGHVLPAQLRLRGGRGLSTALGAMLVLDPVPPLVALGVAVVVAAGSRQLTAAGLAAAVAAPVAAVLVGASGWEVAGMAATALLVVAAHARRTGS